MRKKTKYLFFAIICVVLFAGCGKSIMKEHTADTKSVIETLPDAEEADENSQGNEREKEREADTSATEVTKKVVDVRQTEMDSEQKKMVESKLDEERASLGLTENNISSLKAAQKGNYYYECLSEDKQLLYVEIYQILSCFGEDILLTTKQEDWLPEVYQTVINDHPEIFYSKGFSYTRNTIDGEISYLTLSGDYTYSQQEAVARMQQIDAEASRILSGIPAGADAYTAVKYVYEYIILNTDYGEATADHQNICSVFLDKVSVCNGYAKSMQYLLKRIGIPCIIVNGTAKEAHAWNLVQIDGEYYQVDVTWGDPSYSSDNEQSVSTPRIDYSYLCIPTWQMSVDHIPSSDYELPVCNSMNANYFVREGLYFTEYDEAKLQAVFEEVARNGNENVCIKAADQQVYDMLCQKLIQEQEIFRYLGARDENGVSSLAYSQNDALYTLSFWY